MLIFILMNVQYSQKAIFSFEKGSNHQDHSFSGSLHLVKKFPPIKFPIPLNPLPLFGRPQYIKLYAPLCSTMRRQFSFYQKFLVLIKSTSEG